MDANLPANPTRPFLQQLSRFFPLSSPLLSYSLLFHNALRNSTLQCPIPSPGLDCPIYPPREARPVMLSTVKRPPSPSRFWAAPFDLGPTATAKRELLRWLIIAPRLIAFSHSPPPQFADPCFPKGMSLRLVRVGWKTPCIAGVIVPVSGVCD